MKHLICRLIGHVPVWRCGTWASPDYECKRCGRDIYFWEGHQTGWFETPETEANRYRGSVVTRLIERGRR